MRGTSKTDPGILEGVRRTAFSLAALALACAGCGSSATSSHRVSGSSASALTARAHPQAVEPVAGAAPTAASGDGAQVSVDSSGAALAQPVSNAEVRAELVASGLSANPNQSTLTPNLLAIAPIGAPAEVQAVINAGNEIAHLPYIWGGGHGTYEDTGYDCSGSISFVLAAAGLLKGTETSGQLMSYGDSGPGKWITIYATQGHTFMYVAGLRFDTVALAQDGSRWSNRSATEGGGFVARHPPGL
jgi:hypothetical protein